MEDLGTPLIQTGAAVLLAAAAYFVILRLGRRFVRKAEAKGPEHAARATTLWVIVRRVALVVVVVTTFFVVLSIWDVSLAPFLAVGTVLGAAIGFGAQDLVKDLIAGFFILAEDQYRIGDTITIAGTTGAVEDIQFRVTVLRDFEGNVHYVPNGQITVTSNFTSVFSQPIIDVGVAYSTDVDHALAVMADELEKLAADPDWAPMIPGDVEILGVNKLDESAVILRGRLTTAADERWTVRREALRRVKNRFDQEGIEIPFPQVTVHQAGS